MSPILISVLLSLAAGLFIYALFIPKPQSSLNIIDGSNDEVSRSMRVMGFVAGEIYSILPKSFSRHIAFNKNEKIQKLVEASGNPWNLKATNFNFMRVISALIGFIIGVALWLFSTLAFDFIPWFTFAIIFALIGYFVPVMVYRDAIKNRSLQFKRELPDALNLMIISLSSGMIFSNALRETLPNIKPGVLKDELSEVSRSIDSGKTVIESLDYLAKRAPDESINAFVRSIQEAIELNVPIVDVLEARSKASQKEYFALLQMKTASLDSKMLGILVGTMMPAIIITVLAPTVFSLVGSL